MGVGSRGGFCRGGGGRWHKASVPRGVGGGDLIEKQTNANQR